MMTDGHTDRGKWSEKGVPKKGWICVGIDDLGEPSTICEMCESVEIRYVHSMQHPNYAETLDVGCVCAEHMEQDYVRPKEREKKLRQSSRRRKNWGNRKWRVSSSGSPYLNTDGFNLTVFEVSEVWPHYWQVRVIHRATKATQVGIKKYKTADEAKAAALTALLWAREHKPPSK